MFAPTAAIPKKRRLTDEAADAASTFGFFIDGRSREQMQKLFDILDKDGKGVLEPGDWPSTADGASHWDKMRTHFDVNNDGKITPEEFVNGLKKFVLEQPIGSPAPAGLFSFPAGSHGQHLKDLNESINSALCNWCKSIYESASQGSPAPAPAYTPAPVPVATPVPMFPQLFGGVTPGAGRPVDDQVKGMCTAVIYQIRETYRKEHPEVQFDDATFEQALTPISYKCQVVAGINYFVKAQLAHEKFGHKHVLLRIYKHFDFSTPAVLTAMKSKDVNADSDEQM